MSSTSHGLQYEAGAVHGRFQPFHTGHMRYAMMALDRAWVVYIGVTSPDAPTASVFEKADPVRHLASNNPLSYGERLTVIRAALASHSDPGVSSRVRIVRFDLNGDSSLWPAAIPLEAVQFVVAHEPWDTEKAKRLSSAGYRVEFLPAQKGRVTATRVRDLIRAGDPTWRELVPPGVQLQLETSGLIQRISAA